MIKLISIKNISLIAVCLVFSSCKTRHATSDAVSNDRTITLKDTEDSSYPINSDRIISIPEVKDDIIVESSYNETDAIKVANTAKTYIGTPYRYGGITKKGIDCSGLVYNVYGTIDIDLPRSSFAMSGVGEVIDKEEAQVGDLIFFKTLNRTRINHVGIISRIKDGIIYFIHSSSSRGVIESSLKETYYKQRIVQINRVLP